MHSWLYLRCVPNAPVDQSGRSICVSYLLRRDPFACLVQLWPTVLLVGRLRLLLFHSFTIISNVWVSPLTRKWEVTYFQATNIICNAILLNLNISTRIFYFHFLKINIQTNVKYVYSVLLSINFCVHRCWHSSQSF